MLGNKSSSHFDIDQAKDGLVGDGRGSKGMSRCGAELRRFLSHT